MCSNDLVGFWGMVEIFFDRNSKGKIRVSVKGFVVVFMVFIEENREFIKKEKVFIVGVENSRVLVVLEDFLVRFYDEKF